MFNRPVSKATAAVLAVLQLILAALTMLCALMVNAGQNVVLPTVDGERSYSLWESDRSKSFEDSILFNNIFANNLSAVAEHVAISSQLETGGEYDADKVVDVTAYVNRGTTLAGDYITARYTTANLLKWAQSGFQYETRAMTTAQSQRFLADETTWTHIENNSFAGGMNSYLNAQIEGNTSTFTTPASPGDAFAGSEGYVFYEDPLSGGEETEHNILINRYRTVDGKNIENIVSNWDDYQSLCSCVTETARNLYAHYDTYLARRDYYRQDHSSMRYYIVRSIGGRQEIYTNVESLKNGAPVESVEAYFSSISKSLYYCPYDMTYSSDLLIGQDAVRDMFGGALSAFYPDQIRVYAGVDLAAGITGDDFAVAAGKSGQYLPTSQVLRLMAVIFAVLWFLIFVLRMLAAGHVRVSDDKADHDGKNKTGIGLYRFDRMPLEVFLLLWIVLFVFVFLFIPEKGGLVWYDAQAEGVLDGALHILCAVCASAVVSAGVLSLIRRYKAGRLAADSFICKAAKALVRMAVFSAKNANLAVQTLLPCAALIVFNLVIPSILCWQRRAMVVPVLIFVAALDLAACYIVYQNRIHRRTIIEGIERINAGETDHQLDASVCYGENRRLALAVNDIGAGIEEAVQVSMQDEHLKTELITNVSHDIKTPLTSIINYVDLLKREEIDNDKAKDYIRILEEKSRQLARLTEDLVEASKISSGNVEINYARIDLAEIVNQSLGEFSEKLEEKGLTPVFRKPGEPVFIQADAHHLWRVMENLFGNAVKYSLENTRIYLDLCVKDGENGAVAAFSIRNVSKNEIGVDPKELTERFIRGDAARSSEGSGLGLSIADNLTRLQGGEMQIDVDGDLFKVTLLFALDEKE